MVYVKFLSRSVNSLEKLDFRKKIIIIAVSRYAVTSYAVTGFTKNLTEQRSFHNLHQISLLSSI